MDGFQLLSALRQDKKTSLIPIILLSARAGEEARVDGLEAGADDYLVKPFSAKELKARVKTHIELAQLRIDLAKRVESTSQELTAVSGTLQKETEVRKLTENSLQESEERYKTLAKVSPVGIFCTNSVGDVVYVNQRWVEITGKEISQLTDGWTTGVHEEDKPHVLNVWQRAFDTCQPFNLELRFRLPSSQTIWILAQAMPNIDKSGNLVGYVGCVTDVSIRKKLEVERIAALTAAEEEQKKRNVEAEEHHNYLQQFINMVCHEFRNPLNGIFNNIEVLTSGLEKRQTRLAKIQALSREISDLEMENLKDDQEAITAIDICAKQQKNISDDILYLSHLEAGRVQLNQIVFNPIDILKQTLRIFKTEMSKKGIFSEISTSFQDLTVKGDPSRLQQIFTTLVSNAVRYTEISTNAKKIILHMKLSEQVGEKVILKFQVEDSGVGMTEEQRSSLFLQAKIGQVKTHQEYTGSGLGLFICQQLIELMGGNISVESQKFKGSTFTFTISYKMVGGIENSNSLSPMGNPHASPDYTKFWVLMVEDNLVNQKVLARQLDGIQVNYKIASNGLEAVKMSAEKEYDLILMDVEMPIMGGLEATQIIRTREHQQGLPTVPIVGVSGNARPEQISMAKSAGMDDYIVKPYNKQAIYAVISSTLRMKMGS
eukprot:TRINITY_DN1142_c1_g1_i1.p1 TRINITY_DN1142_c1_g1~~TRINITY_DN1142_c1_g1_i1.p1  ORF type:complete len:670 (-),score=252.33 TRINITY_DN1142_c1_g1_i1:112-2085(-)